MLCFSYILLSTVAKVESRYIKGAMRFEQRFYERIKDNDEVLRKAKEKIASYTSKDTLKAILATSYGYLQILGYNFVKFDMAVWYASPFSMIEDFIDTRNQVRFFFKFMEKYRIDTQTAYEELERGEEGRELKRLAKLWNGSEEYVYKLLEVYHSEKEDVHFHALGIFAETHVLDDEIEF